MSIRDFLQDSWPDLNKIGCGNLVYPAGCHMVVSFPKKLIKQLFLTLNIFEDFCSLLLGNVHTLIIVNCCKLCLENENKKAVDWNCAKPGTI